MRIKNRVLQKVVCVFASVLLLVNSFSQFLLIAPSFVNQVKAQDVTAEPTVEVTPTSEPAPTDIVSPTPTSAAEVSTEEAPTTAPTPTVTPEPISPQAPSQWTFERVELNKEYVSPQNSELKLTFTKLPDRASNIKIEEITLTEDQIKQTGSLSDKAYDITSDMKDGDFSYNLSLPIPESSKGKTVEVKFAEEISNIGSAEKVDNTLTKTDTSVSVASLDHFTIFVVTLSPATDCTGGVYASGICYSTIQAAIDNSATVNGDTINVSAGNYVENVSVTKDLTLQGVAGTNLQGKITISHNGVTIDGFNITNPSVGYGIIATDYSNLTITNNTIHDIGTTLTGGSAQATAVISSATDVSDITISNNTISNVGNLNLVFSGSGSAKGIYLGNSNGANTISNVTINNNNISNVFASTAPWTAGRGAYGILVNHKTTGLNITNNSIETLEGLWAHAIGLEGNTPSAVLSNNIISNLISHKTPTDAFAIYFESNTSKNTVSLNGIVLGDTNSIVVNDEWTGYSNNPVVSVGGNDYIFGVNAFATIQNGISAVSSGGTVNVAAGTYTEVGQIVIDKNLSIVGEDKTTTTIKPNTDYLDSWFVVNTGIIFNLSKVTLDGTGKKINKAIKHQGSGVINDNNFTEIKNSSMNQGLDRLYAGTAIAIDSTENVDITNNEFTQIGRNGILADGNTGTVSGNTYTGKGAGDWMDYFILSEYGDNITISNNTISNNRGVALTDGSDSSGIAVWDDPDTQATINGNTFTNNTSGVAIAVINGDSYDPTVTIGAGNIFNNGDVGIAVQSVGAFGSPTVDITDSTFSGNEKDIVIDSGMTSSNITIHNSSFSGNTSSIVNNGTGIIDAENNWWGNALETDIQSKISGEVDHDPWYLDAGKTTLSSTIGTIFDGVSSTLASQGIASNIGDLTASNYTSFSNLYFEKTISGTKMGRITFTAALDLSNEATQIFLQHLGDYMEASQGSMKFDATTQAGMKAAGAEIKMYGVDALGYIDGTTPIIVRDDAGNILSEGDTNYPTLSSISYVAGDDGTITFSTNHFTQFDLPGQDQTTPDSDGNATADSDTPQVVITNPDKDVTVTVDGSTDATIDVSAFITDGEGDIPKITINSDSADVSIPATKVTGPTGWDGVIAAPTVTTIDLPVVSGETSTPGTAIEIGFSSGELSFDNAVRILLPGQAGKRAGYSRPGTDFREITNTCVSVDNQTDIDADLVGLREECKIDSGLDLVIWTKHFTKFAAYTQTTNSTSSSSSSSTSSNPSAPVCNDQKPGNAPFGLTAVAGLNSVTLTWNKASDPVTYYLMTFGTSPGSQTYGNPNIGNKDTTSYTVSGLSGGTTYYFRVRAGNGCMPGDFSNEASASPSGGFIEGVPAGFEAGVLGEATKSAELTEELIGEPTPTTAVINAGLVKGIQSIAKNKSFKYIFPIILIILLGALIFYFYKKRNS